MRSSINWAHLDLCGTCGVPARAQCIALGYRAGALQPKARPHSGRPYLPAVLPFGVRPRPCGACRALVITCKHWPDRPRRSAHCDKTYRPEVLA